MHQLYENSVERRYFTDSDIVDREKQIICSKCNKRRLFIKVFFLLFLR